MSWQDRDYNREPAEAYGGGGGGMGQFRMASPFGGGGSIVKWLIGINVAIFLIDLLINAGRNTVAPLSPFGLGAFTIADGLSRFQLWRLVTYQFLHGSLMHLLFNMIGLFFFGPLMERWWGSRRFLVFYLLCGACGAWLFAVMHFLVPGLLGAAANTPLVGASGSLYGILIGCAMIYPHQKVMLLFPPIPLKMRTLAIALIALSAVIFISGGDNAGGHVAHLGGALFGFMLIRNPRALDFADDLSVGSISEGRHQRAEQHRHQRQEKDDAEVDRILTKVKEQGLHSLTDKEKKILRRATDRQRRAS